MGIVKQNIPYLGRTVIVKKNRYGIQNSNRRDKPWKRTKRTRGGRLIPFVKFCLNCKTERVYYHHRYCNKCHRELHPDLYKDKDDNNNKVQEL